MSDPGPFDGILKRKLTEMTMEAMVEMQERLRQYDAAIVRIHRILVGADPVGAGKAEDRCDHAASIAWEFIEARGL